MSAAIDAILWVQCCSNLHHPYASLSLTGSCGLSTTNFVYLLPKGSHFLWVWNAIRFDLMWWIAVGIVEVIGSSLFLACSAALSLIFVGLLLVGLSSTPPKTTIFDHFWLVILMVIYDSRAHATALQHLLGLLLHIATLSNTFCVVWRLIIRVGNYIVRWADINWLLT